MDKNIFYPYRSSSELEEFSVVLDHHSANGVLAVGFLSQSSLSGGYTPVTCSEEKMPFCQALIVKDSSRFGRALPQILEENGLGKIVGESQEPGFRGCAVFQFDPDMLRGIDPKVFAEYERANRVQQRSPIDYELRNIKGAVWRVAVQDVDGRREAFAAMSIGNPDAPIIVAPEKDSYVLITQGMSPQSYQTMEQAIDRATEIIRALPEQERDAYLAHPAGKEGVYQLEDGEYSINAFADPSGMVYTEILETGGLLGGEEIYEDSLPFDEEIANAHLHDGYMSVEECVRDVAGFFLDSDNPQVEFAAPCNHPIKAVGEYREVMGKAQGRAVSLADLVREAREKAHGKNIHRQQHTRGHKPPELGL